jgi:biopolymer transport protein ExbB
MRGYATSKFRILMLAALLIGAGLAVGDTFAQEAAGAAEAEAKPEGSGVLGIILRNIDFVFVIIILLSIYGMTLIIQGAIKFRRSVMFPEATTEMMRQMIKDRKFKELIEFTETDPSFVAQVLNPALKRAPSFSSMKEAMETAIGEKTADQFRKIEFLNIIGNLGPLLGLLGTVLGMIDAFSAMEAAGGSVNPSILAGGISKALAHTFLGLFLAVPCLAAFGVLRTIVDKLTVQGALIAEELLLMIKPQEAKPAAAAAVAAKPAAPKPAAPKPAVPAQA